MQEIITYAIIGGTVLYCAYALYNSIKPTKKPSACDGCSGCDLMNKAKTHSQKELVKTHACSQ